ncbi:MAG: GNAT family N-acetyltransferase [Anaerolineaceae bacterium]|nr:MAG: GNAT family N-acetyltransferase [Anaerolineaceae bacterium]
MQDLEIRRATELDVEAVRQLFVGSYGRHYRYREFYDDYWLKKAIFSDNYLVLVATRGEQILGSASITFDVGSYTDLQGEFGRLVVHPDARRQGIGSRLMDARLQFARERLHFGFVHGRTVHIHAQHIAERYGFQSIGFLPQKSLFSERESIVVMGQLFRSARALRRNNPQIIPEVFPLAAKTLSNMGLPNDARVMEDALSYPMDQAYELTELTESGIPYLLRIERGRLKRRQVFGNMMLSYGYFALQAKEAKYLVASQEDTIVGAIGYVFDRVGKTIQIIEIIDVDNAVAGFLLRELDRRAREELDVAYAEVAVSAYWPRVQRTLDQLGFSPVAYCPSAVFRGTERLDAVRMAKLYIPFNVGHVDLLPSLQEIYEIVMRGFLEKRTGIKIDDFTRSVSIFKGLTDAQLRVLSGICKVVSYQSGDVIFSQDEINYNLYMVLNGEIEIRMGEREIPVGKVLAGDVLGEISLVEGLPHSATAVAAQESRLIMMSSRDFEVLIQRYPRIGMTVMRNISRSLGEKLKTTDLTVAQLLPASRN